MKRLITTICIILIAVAGMMTLAGCDRTGEIQFSDPTAAVEESAVTEDVPGGTSSAATEGQCDPVVITNTVIEVVGGDEDLEGEPEGQTCLMSRVPDDVGVVVSILKGAQSIVAAMVDAFPRTATTTEAEQAEMDEKEAVLQQFMMPFSELGLEEVVGFAKFKYIDGVMEKPDDACRECMNTAFPTCLPEARTECETYNPPPDDLDRCAWEKATEGGIISVCDEWAAKCYDKCSEEKSEPESVGVLVRWWPSDEDADGTQKFTELDAFRIDTNKQILESAVEKWDDRCSDPNNPCDPVTDLRPTELDSDKSMEIKQIDSTVALVYSGAAEPALVEPVRICNFIRFDGIKTRPPVYGELNDMRLIMKVKPGEPFTAETRDSRKLIAGIDLRDSYYRLYAGVVDRETLATGAFLSSVINLGDQFGMEVWSQMMLGLVR